jgi:carbon monoxide dehydrogenase subunit G
MRLIDAPHERVFAALTDPAVVAAALPVLRSHRVLDDDHFDAKVRAPLPFAPAVTVHFEIVERRPPEHAAIRSNGRGVRIVSSFDLAPEGRATRVQWQAELELTGILAAFGGHGLEPLARRASDRVLDRVAAVAAE